MIDGILHGPTVLLMEESKHALDLAHQHILFVLELRVKRRAADVGAVDDLLHRDPVVPLLLHQRQQGVHNEPATASRASIVFPLLHSPTLSEQSWSAVLYCMRGSN